ncbi:MAG: SDR family oxidoreductase [Xanthomonadales bacterium]|nr:SDR family oxidoreductase [Gammaproteobacteria bacterium]MBT8050323.1 SDR family oxidoreductase [Gammaproteobacteria bacterium]MBT8056297.1 SDR family oxidoreductase [Gammaproteobacteria bacterium]NNJ79890.1 SDR family oxidoreductase [Xanthomonadales bacterium]NNL04192.1 SDR family oxidoreductase [Xanthomonadales bacterium]
MTSTLITGANRGIGLEMTRQLSARGDTLIAACRRASPELEGLGVEVIEGVDVGSDESVATLVKALSGRRLDRLVNNAGILQRTALDNLDWGAMVRQFEVNSIGPLRVTAALRGNLAEGSKVFIVTSRMGSIEDNTSGGSYGYRMSKAAVNMAGKSLAVDLQDDGIGVFLLHPGWVATEMTGGTGIAAEESAAGLVRTMDRLEIDQSGSFWHQEGYELPW